jgi:hypothetical protein
MPGAAVSRGAITAALLLALTLVAGCSGGSDDPSALGPLTIGDAQVRREIPLPRPLDFSGLAARGTTIVLSRDFDPPRVSFDDGSTWLAPPADVRGQAVAAVTAVGPRGFVLGRSVCTRGEVNYDYGCAPGAAALVLFRLEGRRWVRVGSFPLPDRLTSEAGAGHLAVGADGAMLYSYLTYPHGTDAVTRIVLVDRDGHVTGRARVAGTVGDTCRSGDEFVVRAIRWPVGEQAIGQLLKISASGSLDRIRRPSSRPAFCHHDHLVGLARNGRLLDEGSGERLARTTPFVDRAFRATASSSGSSGLLTRGQSPGERVDLVWSTARGLRRAGFDASGGEASVAAVDGDRLLVAHRNNSGLRSIAVVS